MPIAKVRLPDGRIGRFEVPEGTTPEQVIAFATQSPEVPTEIKRQPRTLKNAYEQVMEQLPTRTPMESDWWTENLPRSFARAPAKIATDIGHMAYNAAKNFTDPIAQVWKNPASLEQSAKELWNAPGKTGKEVMEGFARFKGEPLGLYGADAAKRAWSDPGMVALALSPEISATAGKIKPRLSPTAPMTKASSNQAAGSRLDQMYEISPEFQPHATKNIAQLAELPKKVQDSFSQGQRANSLPATAGEHGILAANPKIAEIKGTREAEAQTYMQKRLSKSAGKPGLLSAPQSDIITGANIHGAIKEAQAPVIRQMGLLDKALPGEYKFSANILTAKVSEIKGRDLTPKGKSAVKEVEKILDEYIHSGQITVKSVDIIEQAIGDIYNKYADTSAAKVLSEVKKAARQTVDQFSKDAMSGGKVDYKGEIYDSAKLGEELTGNRARLAELEAALDLDLTTMHKEIQAKVNPVPYSPKAPGESTAGYAARVAKDYERHFSKPPLTKRAGNYDTAKGQLGGRNEQIKTILQESAQPIDAAAALTAKKDFAHDQWYNRFKKGEVDQVTRRGNQELGTQTKAQNIPQAFDSPSGARGLKRAVGTEVAAEQMTPFYEGQLTTILNNKGLQPAWTWAKQKSEVLKAYGIEARIKEMIRGQMPKHIETFLEKKRPGATSDPMATAAEVRVFLNTNMEVMKAVYGKKSKIIRNTTQYLRMIEAHGRNKGTNASHVKGSQTFEKFYELGKAGKKTSLFEKTMDAFTNEITAAMAGWHFGGGPGMIAAATGAKAIKIYREHRMDIIKQTMGEAVLNPKLASEIVEFSRGNKADAGPLLKETITAKIMAISQKPDNEEK